MTLSFPLGIALIPYAVVLLLFAFMAAFNVYNLIRFDATTRTSFLATFCFFAGASLVLFLTWNELKGVDWRQNVEIGSSLLPSTVNNASL